MDPMAEAETVRLESGLTGDMEFAQHSYRVPLSDSNGDGKLSEAEFRTDTPFGAATFACLDNNQNGFISPDEIQRFKSDFYSSAGKLKCYAN